MFECGDGRISELLSRWLLRLGLTARSFIQEMEAVSEDTEDMKEAQEAGRGHIKGARRLVEAARGCWPHSSEVSVIFHDSSNSLRPNYILDLNNITDK